ncbi:MAG: chemotaxis protein CheX, partial [Clostridiales bacterium]|nr:chemotaxis protein CheX [Clostridiales bacterium]
VKIMAGMEMDELDVFASSALGEVANIIGGNAMTKLTEYKYSCDITPPQIIIGEHKSASMASEKALLIPIQTDIGEFTISIFITD